MCYQKYIFKLFYGHMSFLKSALVVNLKMEHK